MEFRAIIRKEGDSWIGWLVDLPGVNAQEKTREELLASLRIGAQDMIMTPAEPDKDEELVSIEV